ncbi:MAG: aminotransferase class V-fold PLP-dependent enzyme [Gammaproteobacteria bacterium]|nr:aminotransferase class V-fold PLP-dependent enzyme [Gammaproteobacteria bacterium]NIN61376.1 aminotransferase class V-fold PLP-dependent enzyme [Gammaproteobacteria bacterium]NIO61143.1 aminotransferase class V-fold PLP-dependent enzyme [Gammaproteobacteria bacterium]NIP48923.1 aminotransferase class V-fold PLP-dependent enzyme [Gammaproteobacteria bacterium]NIQ09377.1 aminotransferase class V-fold PLP-dependent enzyme [Gammaproteobacteria bacterium]
MPGRNFLFIPGPTNVPRRIQNAMNIEQEDMRAMDLPAFTKPLYEDMKKIFKTKTGRVFIFPASGTGGWESAVANTLSPGDKVLMSGFGHFSNLWIDLCQRWGLDVQALEVEWGEGVPVEQYAEILKADKNKEIKAVFATQNETSTGVTSDIAGVRKALDAADHPALLFIDGVSSVASIDFRMDEWGVDLCVSGSQKGLMLPTGLGIVCASEKALEASKDSKLPKTFFAWEDQIKTNDLGFFPYTPPMNLLRGLRVALDMLLEEGLENVFTRHNRMANAVRAAVAAWGMEPIAKDEKWYSDTVTAVKVPEGFDGNEVVRHAYKHYNLALSISLAKIAGQAFRIGHLGDLNELMILTPINGAEMAMKDLGYPIELGSGVAAAQEYLRNTKTVELAN